MPFQQIIYTIKTDNLIQWRPNNQGIWMANERTRMFPQYGLELGFELERKWGNQIVAWKANNTFTKSTIIPTKQSCYMVLSIYSDLILAINIQRLCRLFSTSVNALFNTTTDNSDSFTS